MVIEVERWRPRFEGRARRCVCVCELLRALGFGRQVAASKWVGGGGKQKINKIRSGRGRGWKKEEVG